MLYLTIATIIFLIDCQIYTQEKRIFKPIHHYMSKETTYILLTHTPLYEKNENDKFVLNIYSL